MHPRSSKTLRCALTRLVTWGSNGIPPKFLYQATRTPLKSRFKLPVKRPPGSDMEMGHLESGPAITLSKSARSETVRASGPWTEMVNQALPCACRGTRPGAVRNPTTLQNEAGFRREPPLSLPSAIGTIPQAKLTAAPPLLPPHVLVR